jgi:bla regulator protein blaR1
MDLLVGFASSQLVSNLALTLIHFVWQGAVIGGALWLFLLCIPRNKFNLRYRVAVLALILSVLTPIFTFQVIIHKTDISSSANSSLLKASIVASSQSTQFLSSGLLVQRKGDLPEQQKHTNQIDYLAYVLAMWILGCLLMSCKFVLDLNRTFKLTRTGVAKVNHRVESIVSNLSYKYRLRRKITILKSRRVNVPVVIGWLRPVILLPIAITIGLQTKHLELIIAHELAHIKRLDFAVNILQSLVQICLFYHPAIYWINKVIRDEREYICDQYALKILGNDESAKINLAKALLGTEELREGNLSLMAVAASGGMLKHRISHILDSQYKPATSIKSIIIGSVVFLISFAALSTSFDFKSQQSVNVSAMVVPLEEVQKFSKYSVANKNKLSSSNLTGEVARKIKVLESVGDHVVAAKTVIKKRKVEEDSAELAFSLSINHNGLVKKVITPKQQMAHLADSNEAPASIASNLPVDIKPLAVQSNENKQVESTNSIPNPNPKIAESNEAGVNNKRLEKELFLDLSSKALTEQYLLPNEAVAPESRLDKTAGLEQKSILNFEEPKAIFTPYPKYPRRAWDKMINQTVRVNFNIDTEGQVNKIDIMQDADEAFSDEILRRLTKWKYQPAVKNGKKVAHLTSLEFVFKAPQKKPIPTITTGSRIRRR